MGKARRQSERKKRQPSAKKTRQDDASAAWIELTSGSVRLFMCDEVLINGF